MFIQILEGEPAKSQRKDSMWQMRRGGTLTIISTDESS